MQDITKILRNADNVQCLILGLTDLTLNALNATQWYSFKKFKKKIKHELLTNFSKIAVAILLTALFPAPAVLRRARKNVGNRSKKEVANGKKVADKKKKKKSMPLPGHSTI